ncbi:CD59 glycoprotein-like [Trichomycterus rosablanca]|uniref:CD59 glycoprotein-like n=1 Tax=Trichomycterus rosablanca TaxID=2290929 RepID=UPI002F35FADA
MKVFVPVGVVFVLALLSLGSAIKCFSCQDYTGNCAETSECSRDDACLTLNERGGKTYRKCIKYSDCEVSILSPMFPKVSSYSFRCCNQDLCNSAPVTAAGSSVLGLLFSLLLWFVL